MLLNMACSPTARPIRYISSTTHHITKYPPSFTSFVFVSYIRQRKNLLYLPANLGKQRSPSRLEVDFRLNYQSELVEVLKKGE